ncbi:TadE/TadG family type IV pilus assembly protein [Catenulispora subtropica]|uniref:TadE/TadG family type IV pilus assembly protein n=1 Tax=Catenulispora subtropica TaxID=450798 RepID=UPI0031D08A17
MSTLEITIVFPVFFAALMLVFQAAMYHYTAQVALAAAQVGARRTAVELGAGVPQATAIADGRTAAVDYLVQNGGSRLRTVDAQAPGGGLTAQGQIQFVVTADEEPLPFIPPLILPISRTAIANPEIFTHG